MRVGNKVNGTGEEGSAVRMKRQDHAVICYMQETVSGHNGENKGSRRHCWNKGPVMMNVEDKNRKPLSSKPSIGHYSGDHDHFCLVARAA